MDMDDKTTGIFRLCWAKARLGGEDAPLFYDVIHALMRTHHESECRGRLEEARIWFDKWHPLETQDLAWASDRVATLQRTIENKAMAISMKEEMVETICNLAENDPSVPLIEAQYGRMPLAELKKLALAIKSRRERKGAEPQF
jgi:hypothetical protein